MSDIWGNMILVLLSLPSISVIGCHFPSNNILDNILQILYWPETRPLRVTYEFTSPHCHFIVPPSNLLIVCSNLLIVSTIQRTICPLSQLMYHYSFLCNLLRCHTTFKSWTIYLGSLAAAATHLGTTHWTYALTNLL